MEKDQEMFGAAVQTNDTAAGGGEASAVTGEVTAPQADMTGTEPAFVDGVPGAAKSSGETDGDSVGSTGEGGGQAAQDGEKKPMQSKAQNAAFAARRREAETARRVREAEVSAVIDTLGGVNPYTGKPMKDALDVDEYRKMREIEQRGGNVREDYAEAVKEERRQADRDAERDKWFRDDLEAFRSLHADVDVNALIGDASFARFADGKVGSVPLAQLYDDYVALRQSIAKDERAKEARRAANAAASPGALHDAGDIANGFFTPDQVRAMSPAQVHKNYDKIKESMKRWQ